MYSRNEYTKKDERYLAQYIAKYNPQKAGRQGNALYMRLCENADGKWPFSKRHTWQSWRNHYCNNKTSLDRQIAKYIDKDALNAPVPAQNPSPPPSSRREASERVPFSLEDDRNIIQYLVTHTSSSPKGQNYWLGLAEQALPWVKRHTWQSWRERYKNNSEYFEQEVRRHLAGDHFDEPAISRPKTVEDYRVRKPPPSSRSVAGPSRKRPRASEAVTNEQPAKKARVAQAGQAVEEPKKQASIDLSQGPVGNEAVGLQDAAEEPQRRAVSEPVQKVEEGAKGLDREDEGTEEDDDEDDEEEEVLDPPGSEDYRNEIFDEPDRVQGEDRGLCDTGEDENEDTEDEILDDENNSVADEELGEMDVFEDDDTLQVDLRSLGELDAAETDRATTDGPPVPHDPPVRKPNVRIRDTEAPSGTPELSPTQEAATRHHVPQPIPRRHARRIKKAQDVDFFGTPPPVLSDVEFEGDELDSPTAEAEARHHPQDPTGGRQPTRLDQGTFNKAFSDPKGRSRISPSGRRSGVEFVNDVDVAGQDNLEKVHASQWPPVRGKGWSHPTVPSTPGPAGVHKSKEHERTVTTIVSVQTVHTVEHRVDRRPKATPFPRHSRLGWNEADADDDLADEPGLSLSPPQTSCYPNTGVEGEGADGGVGGAAHSTWPEPSQHHPFSQVPHPFSRQVVPSPARPPPKQDRAPLSKTDVSYFQRLLNPQQPAAGPSKASPQLEATAKVRRSKASPLPDQNRRRLENLFRMKNKSVFPNPSERSEVSPDDHRETPFDDTQSSPLASKGDPQLSATRQPHNLVKSAALGWSENGLTAIVPHVNKGKGRAGSAVDAHARRHTMNGYDPNDVFYQPHHRAVPSASKQHNLRQSLPSAFPAGENDRLGNRSALSLALDPWLLGHSHTPSLASTAMLSRSVSPTKSTDTSLADTLPPNEFKMIKDLGMNTALHIMARNHGFNEDTVRTVYLNAGSLETTDNILRKMRESANETANEALSWCASDDVGDGDSSGEDAEEGQGGEEAEVLRHLTQEPDWPQDGPSFSLASDLPLAESSRIHVPGSRRRQTLVIKPLPDTAVAPEYSPPKHTRAARHLKRAKESLGQ
ncbi:hypothetical protein C2E23DRAFT_723105 [Lenzites betulinus]|nr:hypothetical protein C2E23DRAFT_723105 [Lenzites betulinus]